MVISVREKPIQGSIVALVTPMLRDNSVDFNALDGLVMRHLEAKTDAFVVLGTTGEAATLTSSEKEQVVRRIVSKVNGASTVWVGTGTLSTAETIENSRQAESWGADGCLVVVPPYIKPVQAGLLAHFTAVADAVSIPIMLYNVPGRTVAGLEIQTISELVEHDNIVAIKEASGDLGFFSKVLEVCADKAAVLTGNDPEVYDVMLKGAQGVVSVAANVVPSIMKRMTSCMLDGRSGEGSELSSSLSALNEVLFIESNPIPVKHVLVLQNLIQPVYRLPLTPLGHEHHERIAKIWSEIKEEDKI